MKKTLMQLIKMVLDEAYAELPVEEEAQKDKLVKAELARLAPEYRNLTDLTRHSINYSDPVTRFAYIYKYTVAHADEVLSIVVDEDFIRRRPLVSPHR